MPKNSSFHARVFLAAAMLLVSSRAQAQAPIELPASYQQLWADPELNQRIDKGIEAHRKSDAVLQVVTADGTPVPNAEIEVVQETHDFLFGCNLFFLNGYPDAARNKKYEEGFAHLFNFGSAPFYWSDLEPEKGHPRYAKDSPPVFRRPAPDLALEFAQKYRVTLKGHPLFWDYFAPPWLPKDKDEVARAISDHFAQLAQRYADKIKIWDVVNETLGKRRDGVVVPDDYVAFCFKEAAHWFPADNILLSNETREAAHHYLGEDGKQSRYYLMLSELKERGIRFDGIGFQFHFANTEQLMAGKQGVPKWLFKVYDLYEEFERPLFITEMSVGSPGEGKSGQAAQAVMVRNLYRLLFSVRRMAGITWWNLADGTAHKWDEIRDGKHYVADENKWKAGLLDEELEPKQAYRALDQLINHEWKTRVAGQTDAAGEFKFRGFHGYYKIIVRHGNNKRTFDVHVSAEGPRNHKLVFAE